ncbi:defective chorion-1 protein, FC125 isoform-like [Teleopsis dalmanni]|uniref:defective chorion-1 protein, FC125 isoform-like n=1 Tax=Teleopsis dalmanni TaxID=139649 RepID=UPI0018CE7C92|nr:defective chorion-1 protein, FC125 isoform-like [Teleopsis dalmanni]
MGIRPIDRPDDPWRQKPYDLHRPLVYGGGSYEPYLTNRRYKRDIQTQTPTNNILTPDMLERLLKIKIDFQRRFPILYKSLLEHTKQTKVSIKPPVIPSDMLHSVMELAAAEKNPDDDFNRENKSEQYKAGSIQDDIDYFQFDDADD